MPAERPAGDPPEGQLLAFAGGPALAARSRGGSGQGGLPEEGGHRPCLGSAASLLTPEEPDLIPPPPGVTLIPSSGVLPLADSPSSPASPLLLASARAAYSGDRAVPAAHRARSSARGRAARPRRVPAGRAGQLPLPAAPLPSRSGTGPEGTGRDGPLHPAAGRPIPPGNRPRSPAFGGCPSAPQLFPVLISRWEASGFGLQLTLCILDHLKKKKSRSYAKTGSLKSL